jgi:hypothetical protein
MKTEKYEKVIIKSESDLPTKAGMYFVGVKDNLEPEDVYEWNKFKNPSIRAEECEYWIHTFDWYLRPIPKQTETAENNIAKTETDTGHLVDMPDLKQQLKEADEILCNVFDSDFNDLQLYITLNPSKERIIKAMEEYHDQFKGQQSTDKDIEYWASNEVLKTGFRFSTDYLKGLYDGAKAMRDGQIPKVK